MRRNKLQHLNRLLQSGIDDRIFPGAVAYISQDSEELFFEAFGNRMVTPQTKPMLKNTIFDLASLTKPLVTATSILSLANESRISLHDEVVNYLPEFKKRGITIFQLLTHTSGLPAWKPLYLHANKDNVVSYLGDMPLENPSGEKVVYSCLGYILLGKLIERVSGLGLDEFAKSRIFKPLDMHETMYNPPLDLIDRCAATENSNSFEKRMVSYQRHDWREGIIVGQVHDENANFLGGVAGNAGLFSTASDLAKYCEMILTKGERRKAKKIICRGEPMCSPKGEGRKTEGEIVGALLAAPNNIRPPGGEKTILDSDSVKLLSTNQTPKLNESRSLGWIILDDGTMFHTGFTGTAIWINPKLNLFAILLTNRVHPDATRTGIVEFRKKFYETILVFIGGTGGSPVL